MYSNLEAMQPQIRIKAGKPCARVCVWLESK